MTTAHWRVLEEAVRFARSVEDILIDSHWVKTVTNTKTGEVVDGNAQVMARAGVSSPHGAWLGGANAEQSPLESVYGVGAFQMLNCPCNKGILNFRNPFSIVTTLEFRLWQALEIPVSEQYGVWLISSIAWNDFFLEHEYLDGLEANTLMHSREQSLRFRSTYAAKRTEYSAPQATVGTVETLCDTQRLWADQIAVRSIRDVAVTCDSNKG